MNKTTTIKVEKVIDVEIAKVKGLLLELSNYPGWWKKYLLKHDSVYDTVSFKPMSFINLKLKFLDKGERFIKFQYIEGPFHGTGIWEFRELEDKKTYISYTIAIYGRNKLIDWMISTRFFKWKHKNDIYKLISLINRQ
jgi:hypothetical protein